MGMRSLCPPLAACQISRLLWISLITQRQPRMDATWYLKTNFTLLGHYFPLMVTLGKLVPRSCPPLKPMTATSFPVFPPMCTLTNVFQSVLLRGYEAYREPLVIKFAPTLDRTIPPFSIRFVDGFTKSLVLQSIIAILDHLDSTF